MAMILAAMHNHGQSKVLAGIFLYQIERVADALGKKVGWVEYENNLSNPAKRIVGVLKRMGIGIGGGVSPQRPNGRI